MSGSVRRVGTVVLSKGLRRIQSERICTNCVDQLLEGALSRGASRISFEVGWCLSKWKSSDILPIHPSPSGPALPHSCQVVSEIGQLRVLRRKA